MSSKLLVGVGAWLLGAAAATTGSMVAVGQLANGLLTQQLGGTTSSAVLDPGDSPRPTPAASVGSTASPTAPAASVTPADTPGSLAGGAAAQSAAPTLLTSADGSVLATCQSGGAYLVYWSPAQGFSANEVNRGPAPVASVTFISQAGGVVMRVSCSSGTPVARVFSIYPEPSDGPSDE